MRRPFKIAAITIGLVSCPFVIVFAAIALVVLGRHPVADGFESNGIRIVKDGVVSVAVIPLGNGKVALVDAGYDKGGKAILTDLSRRKLTPESVAAILLTHSHPDHIAAIDLFPKAEVMALDLEMPLLEGRSKWQGPLMLLYPRLARVKVTQVLRDGETVTLGQVAVRVLAIPGHTPGSAAYLVNGMLFLGDAADISNEGKIQDPPWITSDNRVENRASLVQLDRRLVQDGTDVKIIACSHSGVTAQGLAPLTAFAEAHTK